MPSSDSPQRFEPELPSSTPERISNPNTAEVDRGKRLNSWKEISAYLERDPRTVQRWEKVENLPVHRHVHSKAGSVYAFVSEIDAWQQSRSRQSTVSEPSPSLPKTKPSPFERWKYWTAGVLIPAAACLLYYVVTSRRPVVLEPIPVSSLPVEQLSPSFSPDGKSVVFAVGNELGKHFQVYVKAVAGDHEHQISSGSALSFSPAWSPDGTSIAYLSGDYGGMAAIWLVSPDGLHARKLRETQIGVWPWNRSLTWTADSQALIATDTEPSEDSAGLFRFGLDGSRRRITTPPARTTDSFPSVSADGRLLAFSRFGAGIAQLYEQPLDQRDQPTRLIGTQLRESGVTSAVWLGNSGDLLVGTGRRGAGQLWRVPRSGKPVPVTYTSAPIVDVAVSRNGERAIFALRRSDANLWTLPLPAGSGAVNPARYDALTSTRDEYNAQYSPDGSSIAFESDRSGSPEVWTSDSDGHNARQLTHFGGPVTGSPHWSPDGKWLAFDSRVDGHATIFSIPAKGGDARRLTPGDGPNVVPSWSHDGKWIYFASHRTGRHEVWRIHPDGSDATQVTRAGGFYAEDAPDGKSVYYTKTRDSITSLWRVNFDGSDEREIAAPVLDRCFAMASRGVYFASAPSPAAAPVLRFLSFESGEPADVGRLPLPIMYGLDVSPDGRQMLFAQLDTRAVELMLVNGSFR